MPDGDRTPGPEAGRCCPVVELRRYTLHPGQREVLIELFDREFLESQEAVGMRVIGQFRDLDDPDLFVWLRGFPDMDARLASCLAFYDGPVWAAHRDPANATMIDSDDVRLLRPVRTAAAFDLEGLARPPVGAPDPGSGALHLVSILALAEPAGDEVLGRFETVVLPAVAASGGHVAAWFVTDHSPNTYPRLPIRTGENLLVWLTRFEDPSIEDPLRRDPAAAGRWLAGVLGELGGGLVEPARVWRLTPTGRSLLR